MVAQAHIGVHEVRVPDREPDAEPGNARSLGERVEDRHLFEAAAELAAGLDRAGRGGTAAVVNLAVALVGDEDEVVLPGEGHQAFQPFEAGDRTLRVGGRAEIGQRDAREDIGAETLVIRQETGSFVRGHADRFRPGGDRGAEIDLVEGVRHQDHRPAAGLALRHRRQRRHEQRLAGAGDRDHVGRRVDRRFRAAIAPAGPGRDGGPRVLGPAHRRVAAPQGGIRENRLADRVRRVVPGFAQGQRDRLKPRRRLDRTEQRAQAIERVSADLQEAIVEHRPAMAPGKPGL